MKNPISVLEEKRYKYKRPDGDLIIRLEPLPDECYERIQTYYDDLTEMIDARDLTYYLFRRGVIHFTDLMKINDAYMKHTRTEILLEILKYRGEKGWNAFLAVLKLKGYDDAYTLLNRPLNWSRAEYLTSRKEKHVVNNHVFYKE